MNKIVQAVNAMILKKEKITDVLSTNEGELYFLYDKKHKWSMIKSDANDSYNLHYYSSDMSLEEISNIDNWDYYQNIIISYNTLDLKSVESYESFAELYNIVKDKRMNMDNVFDDIIGVDE